MILSKLLHEVIIEEGVNNKLILSNTVSNETVSLTTGRYRDIIDFVSQLDSDLSNASLSGVSFGGSSSVNTSNGTVTIESLSGNFNIYFDVSNNSTSLRDMLGFDSDMSDSTGSYVSQSKRTGDYYPSEPIESDTRPTEYGADNFDLDSFQTESASGRIATKGGTVAVSSRSIGVLVNQDELSELSEFVRACGTGTPFAFYHNRDDNWPGQNSEYLEYIYFSEDEPVAYFPEPVDGGNRVWYRSTIPMRQYKE